LPTTTADTGKLLAFALCANVADHLHGGVDKDKFYQGTRMFAPGKRVYVGQPYWGTCINIHVIGMRRISKDFVNCVVNIGHLNNLRLATIYSPTLHNRLLHLKAELFADRASAEDLLNSLLSWWYNNQPPKAADLTSADRTSEPRED
jgi:hypothetical protein